jgi:hypothetical protein
MLILMLIGFFIVGVLAPGELLRTNCLSSGSWVRPGRALDWILGGEGSMKISMDVVLTTAGRIIGWGASFGENVLERREVAFSGVGRVFA